MPPSLSHTHDPPAERQATWPLTLAPIGMVRPKRFVAIGRDAADALGGGDLPMGAVRHPRQGGQAQFVAGMCELDGIVER